MIPRQLLDEIEHRLLLSSYVARYTALEPLGGGYWQGKCPYCNGADCTIVVRDCEPIRGKRIGRANYFCGARYTEGEPPEAYLVIGAALVADLVVKYDPELKTGLYERLTRPRTHYFARNQESCRAHGGIIGLVMRKENLGWRDAIDRLCADADIEPPARADVLATPGVKRVEENVA